ncbi:hypothetical protein Ddye_027331 [Dipteronia dyeriana]|uniref:Uncharacterized protein n=1 Tax=Dipteronia dyeriana TaxID=168575 RepID=A0AAD9TP36_9ROSI|nr:hypothetical protein Ddye_027331 [Dipteronia dyeriana]
MRKTCLDSRNAANSAVTGAARAEPMQDVHVSVDPAGLWPQPETTTRHPTMLQPVGAIRLLVPMPRTRARHQVPGEPRTARRGSKENDHPDGKEHSFNVWHGTNAV